MPDNKHKRNKKRSRTLSKVIDTSQGMESMTNNRQSPEATLEHADDQED